MKTRISICILAVLLFNSCIVKSLFPFFTKDTIHFEKIFLGTWKDNNEGTWEIESFKDVFLERNGKHSASELSEEVLEIYNKYKDGYSVSYTENDKRTTFIAISFKIDNQLFVDFTLEDMETPELNILAALHLAPTHSLAKFEILKNNKLSIKWLDEDIIKELLDQNKIKIKHEKIGFDNSYLLTASSEELQRFIKKYMALNDYEKWKTEVELDLIRIDAKP